MIPVILLHAGFDSLPGGFLGVDVFFVISGFLITTILSREIEQGRFSILGFYERRIRRILPALFLVLAFSTIVSIMVMLPKELKDFGQSLIAVCVFLSNVFFAGENGYFESASELKPLLHNWSLSVEEQFYLVFPVAMLLVHRFFARSRVIVLAGLTVASLAICHLAPVDQQTNFFFTPSRAWELLAGACLASIGAGRLASVSARPALANIAATSGLAMIVLTYLLWDETVPSPSIWMAPTIVGTVLVIAFAIPGTVAHHILSTRQFVFIGAISYSAYLWHQPLFAFARLVRGTPGQPLMLALALLTLGLAWLSWKHVEEPFRSRERIGRGALFVLAAAASALFVAIGGLLHASGGLPERLDGESRLIALGHTAVSPYRDDCGNFDPAGFDGFCEFGAAGAPVIAFLGDSHGKELFWKASEQAADTGHAIQPFLWNGCLPFSAVVSAGPCDRFHRKARRYILENDRIETLVIAANWHIYVDCTSDCPAAVIEGGRVRSLAAVDRATRNRMLHAAILSEIESYRQAGKRIILVGQIPRMAHAVPQQMFIAHLSAQAPQRYGPTRERFEREMGEAREFAISLAARSGAEMVLPANALCGPGLADPCRAQKDGLPYYFDDNHLNGFGADRVVRRIFRRIEAPEA